MTNRWSKQERERDAIPVTKEEVEGSFVCQTCGEYVDVAMYVRVHQVLTWKCSNGHVSVIKDFVV